MGNASRSTNRSKLVTVFGGSGFVGRYVVRGLAKEGFQVRVAVRRPDLATFLQPAGDLGQIKLVQANLRYPDSVNAAVQGAHCVINLAAILSETGRQTFDAIHVFGARAVAEAAARENAPLIHTSAIGSDVDSPSGYGSSRGEGELVARQAHKQATIIRPSIVFGPEDAFFNRFASMARLSPFLPLIGGGHTRFQPVYVGDLAQVYVKAALGQLGTGKIWEIGGGEILSFRQCMEKMCAIIDRNPAMVPLPFMTAKGIGKLTGWLPGAPITYDQVLMLETDNVVSDEANKQKRTLSGLNIVPHTLDSILPSYLTQYRPHGQYVQRDA